MVLRARLHFHLGTSHGSYKPRQNIYFWNPLWSENRLIGLSFTLLQLWGAPFGKPDKTGWRSQTPVPCAMSRISVRWHWTWDATKTLFWLSSTRPSHNTSLSLSLALWIWPTVTFSLHTLCQQTSDRTLPGGVTKISQSAWWNWQCAMTLCSMKLRPGKQIPGPPLCFSQCRVQCKVDHSWGGITRPPQHEWARKLEERTETDENSDPRPYGSSS